MSLRVLGLGTAVPDRSISQADSARMNELFCTEERDRRRVRLLHRHSGVQSRGSVLLDSDAGPVEERQTLFTSRRDAGDQGPTTRERMERYELHAPALAARAARAALANAGLEPHQVSQSITVSCTGFFAPGLDARLVEEVGLRPTVGRTHVGFQGCHGAQNGLRVANGLAAVDPGGVVLVTAVELCTLHVAYGWDAERTVANGLFADGAAALVGTSQAGEGWRLHACGTVILPDSPAALQWRIGDHGFAMSLSAELPGLIERHLRGWLEEWLATQGLSPAEVASWAVHPGGRRVLDAVESALGLPREATSVSRAVLAEHGNMSSATVLFVLDRLRSAGAPRPCVALGFGPGLAIEATLFR
jgi:predicted naringenin-chalcone synthase